MRSENNGMLMLVAAGLVTRIKKGVFVPAHKTAKKKEIGAMDRKLEAGVEIVKSGRYSFEAFPHFHEYNRKCKRDTLRASIERGRAKMIEARKAARSVHE